MKVYLIKNPNRLFEVSGYGWNSIKNKWIFFMKGGQTYPLDECISLPENCINCDQLRLESIKNNFKY